LDPSAPILLFDSGVGGLTVLAELRNVLPQAPVIYVADTAGLPYGEKTEAEIAARVAGLLGVLTERYHPRLAVIACNTASTIALGMVRDVLQIPVVGTVPAIKPAAALTKTGVIGLLGTAATIRQVYVDQLEADFANGRRLLRFAAPELVSAAEAKLRGHPVDHAAVQSAVDGIRCLPGGKAVDVVVLACTHFPLLRKELCRGFGEGVRLIDGAAGIARRIATLTHGQPFARVYGDLALTTGDLGEFEQLASVFASVGIERIAKA
jgi:glutamate racemase